MPDCDRKLLALAAAFILLGSIWAAAEDQIPLPLKLPKPVFPGTPKDVPPGTVVEKSSGKPRPVPLVAKGTANLALGRKATSSAKPFGGSLDLVTDGDKEARDDSAVELKPRLQWVQVDLGAKHTIYAIAFWHYHAQARAYHDVVVQASNDPDFVTDVKTIYNNDHDNSAGMGIGNDKAYIEVNTGRLIDTKGVVGRYVRLYSKGNTSNEMNHYIEVEVFGKPAK